MISASNFPTTLEDVNAAWLSARLTERWPGTEVTKLTPSTAIRGMATKARYELEYNTAGQAHHLPPAVWLKTGFEIHSGAMMSHYSTEAFFFRDLAPLLNAHLPRTYFEYVDPVSQNGAVLFEDLGARNCRFGRQTVPLEPDEVLRVLELQAAYHAALWQDSRLQTFPWLTIGGVIVETDVCGTFLGFWDTASKQPRWNYVPPALRNPERIRRAITTLHELDAKNAFCIVHGDAHQANLYFETDGTPGYLDWATVMRGHWAFDVSYMLIGTQTVENRRRLQETQLKYYLEQLRAKGVQPPSWNDAWLAYRQHAMWMFMTTLCPVELHPEEICMHNAERACAAITDLETLQSLGIK